jgi:hypothetical protein
MDDNHTERKPYLQHQGNARREEGHEHKVVGQDRHAPEAAHDFQLPNPCKNITLDIILISYKIEGLGNMD